MKRKLAILIASVAAAGTTSALADAMTLVYEVPTAEEAAFELDTFATHRATGAVSLPYAAGATLTEKGPDGTETTLVSAASAAGTYSWTGAAGGAWTLANTLEGTTVFTMRYPAATHGAGTLSSPAKIVDEDELLDLGAGVGYVFRPCGVDGLIDSLVLPSGCILSSLGNGLYRLDVSDGDFVYGTAGIDFELDTVETGPDRRITSGRTILPIAYSGDDWRFDPSAASTLTFTSPSGVDRDVACTGTDVMTPSFRLSTGVWTVALSGNGVTPLTAYLDIAERATTILFR